MFKDIKFEEIRVKFHLFKALTDEEKIRYIDYIQMRELMTNLSFWFKKV